MQTSEGRAVVVVESMFGNTRAVAGAIAEGLAADFDATVLDVAEARQATAASLVVAGGPTHAFGMSRRRTREAAIEQGAPRQQTEIGLREWVEQLPLATGTYAATFDTRVTRVRWLPGSAASGAARALRRKGYLVIAAQSFFVSGTPGPLTEGELDRARRWGAEVARQTTARAAGGRRAA